MYRADRVCNAYPGGNPRHRNLEGRTVTRTKLGLWRRGQEERTYIAGWAVTQTSIGSKQSQIGEQVKHTSVEGTYQLYLWSDFSIGYSTQHKTGDGINRCIPLDELKSHVSTLTREQENTHHNFDVWVHL